jgi:hypothetical protein
MARSGEIPALRAHRLVAEKLGIHKNHQLVHILSLAGLIDWQNEEEGTKTVQELTRTLA